MAQHKQDGIYLDQVNWRIVGKKASCCLFKLWLQSLAVATP